MKRNLFVFGVFLILIIVPLLSPAKNIVISQGTSYIHNNRVDIARDKAIESALRSVVEKTVGVMISSTTEVENYEVKLDTILSESRGFINSYRVTGEERDGTILKLTIEADVGVGKLKDRMEALHMMMTRKSMPRLMIIFSRDS